MRSRRRHAPRTPGRKREAVLRRVYLLPNLITTASLFCGILALVNVFKKDYEHACWLILFSAILDVFDGVIARLTHTESEFGLQFDSLSDLVAFGVSPSALMLSFLDSGNPKVVTPSCILYIICGALRLARFNVQAKGEESHTFSGLPIPAAAGCLVSAYLVLRGHPNLETWFVPFLVLGLAFLMVSKVPYPSFKVISLKHRKPFDYLVAIACLAVLIHWFDSIEYVFLAGFHGYVAWGLARVAPRKLRQFRRKPVPSAAGAEASDLAASRSTASRTPE